MSATLRIQNVLKEQSEKDSAAILPRSKSSMFVSSNIGSKADQKFPADLPPIVHAAREPQELSVESKNISNGAGLNPVSSNEIKNK
jgi:hypothetical protein